MKTTEAIIPAIQRFAKESIRTQADYMDTMEEIQGAKMMEELFTLATEGIFDKGKLIGQYDGRELRWYMIKQPMESHNID